MPLVSSPQFYLFHLLWKKNFLCTTPSLQRFWLCKTLACSRSVLPLQGGKLLESQVPSRLSRQPPHSGSFMLLPGGLSRQSHPGNPSLDACLCITEVQRAPGHSVKPIKTLDPWQEPGKVFWDHSSTGLQSMTKQSQEQEGEHS